MNPFHKLSLFALLTLTLSAGSACLSNQPPPDDDDDSTGDDDDSTGDDDDSAGDDDDSAGDDDDSAAANVQLPPDPQDFEALALDAREDLLQSYTVNVNALGYITGEQGTSLSFIGSNILSHQDGSPVTGDVTVELLEVFDKGTMLVANMPSMGMTETGEIAQLISGGEHFVNATQGEEQLVLNTGFILTAPVDEEVGEIEQMTMFRAVTEDGGDAGFDDEAVWVENVLDADGDGIPDGQEPVSYTHLTLPTICSV